VVTKAQLTKLVYERNQGRTISMSAMKSGMTRKTAGKYLRQDNVMEQRQAASRHLCLQNMHVVPCEFRELFCLARAKFRISFGVDTMLGPRFRFLSISH
jgi:hypothetical protein